MVLFCELQNKNTRKILTILRLLPSEMDMEFLIVSANSEYFCWQGFNFSAYVIPINFAEHDVA